MERTTHLLAILDSKGPTAHKHFIHCLGEEQSHMYHKELFEILSRPSLDEDNSTLIAQRKRVCTTTQSPEKRCPKCTEMQGVLKSKKYGQMVRSWRNWVSNGQWKMIEEFEFMYVNDKGRNPLSIRIAGLLQAAIARIVQKHYKTAQDLLELCDHLIPKVEGDNYTFLHGRSKYTWSWLYKYKKRTKKSKKYAKDAMQILFNVGPGEDKALANYGCASILVDCHAGDRSLDPLEVKTIEEHLRFAKNCASIEDRGLDHIKAHASIRLAQLCLGSTHYESGKNKDEENIRKASGCLKAVAQDLSSLPPRSHCIFFLTKSDLYRCKGNIDSAIDYATQALRIAEDNGFQTEITSAKMKLESLDQSSP